MKIKKSISQVLLALCGLTLAYSANANLIVNGDFETPVVSDGGGIGGGSFWRYYNAGDVGDWDGSNIEIWDETNSYGIGAYKNNQFIELNSHGEPAPFSIFQDIATNIGQEYSFTFAYRARVRSADERFRATVAGIDDMNVEGVALLDSTLSDHIVSEWFVYSANFIADSDRTRITFTSISPNSTLGNFIDDVKVASVPEPGTLALLGLGLIGLGFARRKQTS
ncbi:PEP-CTERM sorting domain-containing protein [Porticoccus sp. GXU_MW_L64]